MLSLLALGFIQTTFAQSFSVMGDHLMANTCISLQESALRYGKNDAATNGEVSVLQKFLISKNLLSGEPTGFFGTQTMYALNAYLKSVNIVPTTTGNVGPLTKAAIKKETCVGAVSVSPLKVISSISANQGTMSVAIMAGAGTNNPNISYWGLKVDCDSSVTILGNTGSNICGAEIRVPQSSMIPSQDTALFSSKVMSVSNSLANVILDLAAYDVHGYKLSNEYNAGISLGTRSNTSNVATLVESSVVATNFDEENANRIAVTKNQSQAVASIVFPQVLGAYAACVDLSQNIHRGSESPTVIKLQAFLKAKNLLTGAPTGFFGDLTVDAVKTYQGTIGVSATGMVYEATRQAIKQETCN